MRCYPKVTSIEVNPAAEAAVYIDCLKFIADIQPTGDQVTFSVLVERHT
jgi:hypothetical protein